ncbi:uncharacterized protein [Fopius arisanus]|uniref:Uncharacterized protein n=1 Tax=Fopius arisanus TaxID=64838 RepID=A0A9R1TPC9_9HYME|nr:PREDICTED: uncharacterized protein LOC105272736 [Fopius arisanus]
MKSSYCTSLDPFKLDCEDTLTRIWRKCYAEPVAYRGTHCDNIYCSVGNTRKLYDLAVDHHIIIDKGFREGLPEAIDVCRTWQCKIPGCGATVIETLDCKETVFVELDIRNCREEKGNRTLGCQLRDIPVKLDLGKAYRLIGIIAFIPDMKHFVAHCRRRTGEWVEVDDLSSGPQREYDDVKVIPFGALYISR